MQIIERRFTNYSNISITTSLASTKPKGTLKCKQVVWIFKNIKCKDFINLQTYKKKGMLIGWQNNYQKIWSPLWNEYHREEWHYHKTQERMTS